ncbi:hypothetical protein [Roseateles puraquae]|uniref:Alpha/beta hydrolase n=1 Tax=Roseateles puraquae TaxID=431059 RepID=A0A254N503_9BURK|nr:hypothetical protein [Roseateles puraquae]MDG0856893.1 hypothetical protein [Roseateles puraquae]OWR03139.1 hypothetical protein CDO81_16370 [Roseateles puraquae]
MPARRSPATPRLLATLTLALAGCASGPPAPRPWVETATRTLNLSLASVEVQGRRVTLTRSASASGPLPVVIYLPGIGQEGDSGQRWATAWAQAGYAVLGVQPLEDDAAAWRSPLARTGEFRALGERHYGAAQQADRQAALGRLLQALRASPSLAGVPLDWQRTALAGYEIGAQAVLALGGEAGGWQPRAVIAISPPPMTAVPGTPPALIITSDADGDALGLVTDPAQRRRAFDSLSPGAGWLLRLPSLSHAALSGTLAPDGWHAQDQHRGGPSGAGGGGGRGEMGGGRAPQGPAGGAPRGPRSGSATEAAQADLGEALRMSRAFLDAQLRGAALPPSPSLVVR